MPRQRQRTKAISDMDMAYLAGIFESSLNLRGVGTQGAMAISATESWPMFMANTYGGYHEEFQTRNTEKWFWGWFVPIERRLELLNLLEETGACKAFNEQDFAKARVKMEKSISRAEHRPEEETEAQTKARDDRRSKAREKYAEEVKQNKAAFGDDE